MVQSKKIDLQNATQEERNAYWRSIDEEEVRKQYKPSTIKFVSSEFSRVVKRQWFDKGGKDDSRFLLHEVGCSYTICSNYLELPESLPYLGSDPVGKIIERNREKYCYKTLEDNSDNPNYRKNTGFEVGTIEQMYNTFGSESATIVASLSMFGSLDYYDALDLMVMCGKMAEKVFFLTVLHDAYNPSMSDPSWKGKRKYTSFTSSDMTYVKDELESSTGVSWNLEIVHPKRISNFAAIFTRR